MKIKNSTQSVSPDASIIIMCVGILVACPLRIFQMLRSIDPITGFYDNYSSLSVIVFYSVLALATLLILILTFVSAKVPAAIAPQGRKFGIFMSSLLLSATLLFDAIYNYIPRNNETATIVQNAQSLTNLHHFHAVFALLSCIYFLVFSVSYIAGKSFYKSVKLLSLAPLVLCLVRVLERISVIISIIRVSELLLELCACVFLMIFFMTFARVASGINEKGSMWSVIACGSVSAMFILVYSIPRVMLTLTGNADRLVSGYPVYWSDIACALFIIVFIITTLRSGYKVEDVEKMYNEIESPSLDTFDIDDDDDDDDGYQMSIYPRKDDDGNILLSKNTDAEDSAE